jgi:hypothetical protein
MSKDKLITVPVRGKWLFKKVWFSICSKHDIYQHDCDLCNAGMWENLIKVKITNWFFKLCPGLWRKLANRGIK